MNDGMKKWMPYKSLVEQEDFLGRMMYERGKSERPVLSEDDQDDIERILSTYDGEELSIRFYEDGYIRTIESTICRIDIVSRRLFIDRCTYLDFSSLVSLSRQ